MGTMNRQVSIGETTNPNPTPAGLGFGFDLFGARYRTRTCDPMHVKHVLYQLS